MLLILFVFIVMILVGGLVGWIASGIMGLKADFPTNVLIGMGGGLLGSILMFVFRLPGYGRFHLLHFLMAILGAIILVAIVKIIEK